MTDISATQRVPPKKPRLRKSVAALAKAQALAFSPIVFYATVVLRDMGVLAQLAAAGQKGVSVKDLAERLDINEYALTVLFELAANVELVTFDGSRAVLDDMGYVMENDTMTRVNMNFVRDVCYRALPFLGESFKESRPAGLHTLGDWDTIYDGLSSLEEPVKSSWFEFDHFYSDNIFDTALPIIFDRPVTRLMDIGANTGRWACKVLNHNSDVQLHLVDLPGQLELARASCKSTGLGERVNYYPMNVLSESAKFPTDCEVIWMSQFLDCLDKDSIINLLARLAADAADTTRLCIVEPFVDRQDFAAASLSLNATSLYFSCVANGVSRMYRFEDFALWIEKAGWVIEKTHQFRVGHTLLVCHRL